MAIGHAARAAGRQLAPKPPPQGAPVELLDLADEANPERSTEDSASAEGSLGSAGTDAASRTRRTAQPEWKRKETQRSLLAPNGLALSCTKKR